MPISTHSNASPDRHALNAAYDHCLTLARRHYENFPVASRLLPRRLQKPISVIYAFARNADDFADEGKDSVQTRQERLDSYRSGLDSMRSHQRVDDPVFIALSDVIFHYKLPLEPFYDLLSAFRQDVTKKRYADINELLDYCRRSANPIGRLVLHLTGEATPDNLRDSDAICTALQLINFWQDLEQDFIENDRIYLPQNEMAACGVSETHLAQRRSDDALRALLDKQLERTRSMLLSGSPLGHRLKGRLGAEIRATIHGGLRILDALSRRDNLFSRPRLGANDWLHIVWRALFSVRDSKEAI